MELGQNKYYHSAAVTAQISLRHLRETGEMLDRQQYDNSASISTRDIERYKEKAALRVMNWMDARIKNGEVGIVPISDVARELGLSEKFIIEVLEGFGIELEELEE